MATLRGGKKERDPIKTSGPLKREPVIAVEQKSRINIVLSAKGKRDVLMGKL